MEAADPTGEDVGSIWSGRYLPITLANLTVVAVAAFDGLAIVAALPSMADDLGRVALLPWVITAFLAMSAIAGIAAGPIIDAIGVRRTFRVTGVWFLLTSLAAAAAPNMPLLVAARALQGIGGGLIISVALTAVGLAYPAALRPRAFAANSLVWGALGFGGPVVVAGLLALGSWRLVFIVQVPITALALAAGWRSLPSTRDRPEKVVVDRTGIALIAVVVFASLVGVSQVSERWWAGVVGAILTAAAVAAYWRHSGRAADPVLSRDHLRRFPMRRIHLTSGLVLVAGLAADNYLPLYTQTTRGWSEAWAAFSVLFLTVGWTAGAIAVSRLLERRREAELILRGATVLVPMVAVAGLLVAIDGPLPLLFAAYFGIGLSIGFISTSGLTLLQGSSTDAEMGRANSAHQFIRTLCITYGVAIGGAILLGFVDFRVGDVEAVRDLLGGEEVVVSEATVDAIADGFAWVHGFSLVVALGCLWAALVLRRLSAASLER